METEIYPPELQQEPLMVSRNLTIMPYSNNICILTLAGTLSSQQEPYFVVSRNLMNSAGTLCGQQEPLLLAGTILSNSNIST